MVSVTDGFGVGVAVGNGVGVTVGVAVTVGSGVTVGIGVFVTIGTGVLVGDTVGVVFAVGCGVAVAVDTTGVGVKTGSTDFSFPHAARKTVKPKNKIVYVIFFMFSYHFLRTAGQ